MLIDNGMDVRETDRLGHNPLHLLCAFYTQDDLDKLVSCLIQNGIDINAIGGEHGRNALHQLCTNGGQEDLVKTARALLEHGIDINAKDRYGQTALHILCTTFNQNLLDIVRLMICQGVDVNARNKDGGTALHFLCSNYNRTDLLDIVRLMIFEGGADARAVDKSRRNALHFLLFKYDRDNLTGPALDQRRPSGRERQGQIWTEGVALPLPLSAGRRYDRRRSLPHRPWLPSGGQRQFRPECSKVLAGIVALPCFFMMKYNQD